MQAGTDAAQSASCALLNLSSETRRKTLRRSSEEARKPRRGRTILESSSPLQPPKGTATKVATRQRLPITTKLHQAGTMREMGKRTSTSSRLGRRESCRFAPLTALIPPEALKLAPRLITDVVKSVGTLKESRCLLQQYTQAMLIPSSAQWNRKVELKAIEILWAPVYGNKSCGFLGRR